MGRTEAHPGTPDWSLNIHLKFTARFRLLFSYNGSHVPRTGCRHLRLCYHLQALPRKYRGSRRNYARQLDHPDLPVVW